MTQSVWTVAEREEYMTEQLTVFDIILNHTGHAELTPAEEYFIETGKRTYWQDSQGKPYKWWRRKENE